MNSKLVETNVKKKSQEILKKNTEAVLKEIREYKKRTKQVSEFDLAKIARKSIRKRYKERGE